MRLHRIHSYAAALFMTLALPAFAYAEPLKGVTPMQAQILSRRSADEGLRLYEQGQWKEAYEKLRAAEELHHTPTRLLYMARCQHRLGKLLEARGIYEKLLAEKLPPSAPEAFVDAQTSATKELEIVTVRAPKVKIMLTGAPKDAVRVTVDGVRVATWEKELVLNPGKHTLEVTSATTKPLVRSFTLNQGTTKTIDLVLRPQGETTASAGSTLRRR